MWTNTRLKRTLMTLTAAAVAVVLGAMIGINTALAKKPVEPPPGEEPNYAWVYADDGALWLMNSDASIKTRIGRTNNLKEEWPVWSPSGDRIAYFKEIVPGHGGKIWRDLYVMNSDGSGNRLVYSFDTLDEPTFPNVLSWLPDGNRLLFQAEPDLWVIDITTAEMTSVWTPEEHLWIGNPSIGPDLEPDLPGFQGLIAYSAGSFDPYTGEYTDRDIYILRVFEDEAGGLQHTGEWTQLRIPLSDEDAPVFSPDGNQIVFLGQVVGIGGALLQVVSIDPYMMTLGNVRTLDDTPRIFYRPTWSPDSQWIAYTRETVPYELWDLYRVRVDGTEAPVNVTNASRTWATDWRFPNWNPTWENDIDQ